MAPDLWTQADTPRAQRETPRVGALWQAQDWLSFYGNYAEGFGPDVGMIYPNKPVPPSDARQVEFGAEAEFFGGKLLATATYYNLRARFPLSSAALARGRRPL